MARAALGKAGTAQGSGEGGQAGAGGNRAGRAWSPGGCQGGSGAAAASPASNPPGRAPSEQVALPGRLGLLDRSPNGLESNKSLPSAPQTTSYSAPQHPNPAFLSPENTPNVSKDLVRCSRSIACHSGEDHPQILLPTIWAPRLSRSFLPGFSLPPALPSLLNNRKLSWAKCQWPGRLLPGTGSGAGAVVMVRGDAALSFRRRAPLQQPAVTPGPGARVPGRPRRPPCCCPPGPGVK